MEEERKTFVQRVKKHKKGIIVAGIGIALTATAIIVAHKYRKEIGAAIELLKGGAAEGTKAVPSIASAPVELMAPTNIIPFEPKAVEMAEETAKVIHRAPHDVVLHPRNLPAGQNPSAEKLAMAAEIGLDLEPGQTFVKAYRTGGQAA